jgi:hypothetical protein
MRRWAWTSTTTVLGRRAQAQAPGIESYDAPLVYCLQTTQTRTAVSVQGGSAYTHTHTHTHTHSLTHFLSVCVLVCAGLCMAFGTGRTYDRLKLDDVTGVLAVKHIGYAHVPAHPLQAYANKRTQTQTHMHASACGREMSMGGQYNRQS